MRTRRSTFGRSAAGAALALVFVGGGVASGATRADSGSSTVAGDGAAAQQSGTASTRTTPKSACKAAAAATAGVQSATDRYKRVKSYPTIEKARHGHVVLITRWHRAVDEAQATLAKPAVGSPAALGAFLHAFNAENRVLAKAASKAAELPTEPEAFFTARREMYEAIVAAADTTEKKLSRLQTVEHHKVAACAHITGHAQAFVTY